MNVPLTPLRFLARAQRQFGPQIAVLDGDRRWNYLQYGQRCHQLANLLRQWGLGAGERVAFLGYNTHQLLEAYYGVLLAGGTLLPLNTRLSGSDLYYILEDAQAAFLLVDETFCPAIDPIHADLGSLRRSGQLKGVPRHDWLEELSVDTLMEAQPDELDWDLMQVDENGIAEIFYTSGTTGYPKGVTLTHRNLFLHALETIISSDLRPTDIHLHTVALFHVNGWGTPQSLTALGATHVMLPRFEPEAALRSIQKHAVTTLYLVPTMAAALLECEALEDTKIGTLRQITLGGAAANPQLIEALEEKLACVCVAGYGLTETTPVVSHSSPKQYLTLNDPERFVVQSAAGFPIVGTEVEIRDAQGRALPWDGQSSGEVTIRGDGVMAGYWNKPDETAAALVADGWLRTGDMATISPDGYITIVDRSKDVIISGGENIASLEVERALCTHPSVLEAAVVAAPDPSWGEVPMALVVLKKGAAATQGELIDHCRRSLAHFKCPRGVEFVPSFPKGGTGKVLKRQLRERFWKGRSKRVN